MILWSTNETKLKSGKIGQDTCPICEDRTNFQYEISGTYLHIFWVPTIPLRKTKLLECDTCGEYLFLKEFPKHFREKFKTEVSSRYPIWYYSGLVLSVLLIYVLSVLFTDRAALDQSHIDAPKVGDVYTIEVDVPKEAHDYSRHYTVMKVIKVTEDSVSVMLNSETIKKSYAFSLIDKPEHYDPDQIEHFSKQQIQSLYKTNHIKAVNRR